MDPLTDEYPELTPFQYASSDPIDNIDIDGLEGGLSTAANPTTLATVVISFKPAATVASVTKSFVSGVFSSLWGTVKGLAHVVAHPINTAVALANVVLHPILTTKAIVNIAKETYKEFKNGSANKKANMLGHAAGDIAQLFLGTGEAKLGTEIAEDVGTLSKVIKETEEVEEVAKGGVYVLKDGEAIVRTGRTKNLAQRQLQHASGKETKDLTFQTVYRTDSYAAQRGLEHVVSKKFESTASEANGGLNKIKAISDKTLKSAKGQKYLKAAGDYLKTPIVW